MALLEFHWRIAYQKLILFQNRWNPRKFTYWNAIDLLRNFRWLFFCYFLVLQTQKSISHFHQKTIIFNRFFNFEMSPPGPNESAFYRSDSDPDQTTLLFDKNKSNQSFHYLTVKSDFIGSDRYFLTVQKCPFSFSTETAIDG